VTRREIECRRDYSCYKVTRSRFQSLRNAQDIPIVSQKPSRYTLKLISRSERDKEANIARNRALLAELELEEAISDISKQKQVAEKSKAKPVQSVKRVKKVVETQLPLRQSSRLKRAAAVDLNESPAKRLKREVIRSGLY
jgi:hypothetical protein